MPSRLRRFDEAGHIHFWTISCYRKLSFLWHDDMKRVVIDGFRLLQREYRVCMIAYVIMPDHMHFIVYPHSRGNESPIPISLLLHRFKKYIGFEGKRRLREIWRKKGCLWCEPLNRWTHREYPKQLIFNTRGHDFNITNFKTLLEKIDYCHKNPITRVLVNGAADWRWSSFRFYEMGDRSVLAMDWNGKWPVEW
ncbi:MAG: transposase [Planctomycetes bacterium]|nr:transposase [Planctomycetota bacterium]